MKNNIEELKGQISGWNQVVIIPHTRPDGDAMGASLALHHYFNKKKVRNIVIAPTYYPFFLHWMPGNDKVWQFFQHQPQTTSVVKKADAVFCVDFNALSRIDKMTHIVEKHSNMLVNIDHHLEPQNFGKYQLIDPSASSTCELIYDFIHLMGDEELIDADIASCLYTGIFTDTGGFKHNNTSPKTHKIAAELMEKGADIEFIHGQILENSTANRLQFLGHSLANRLKFYPFNGAAIITITKEDAAKFELEAGDTEGLVNYPLSVKGIKFAILIKEEEDIIKMSFRSKSGFEVNEFARKHFNGGGHAQAAGGRSDESLEKTIKKLEHLLQEYKEELAN